MFMIIDMATGHRMPCGGTKAEPERDVAPRLFARKGHAEGALAAWREGLWYNHIDQYGDGDGPIPYDSPSNKKLAAERQARDMRVVAVRLEVLA